MSKKTNVDLKVIQDIRKLEESIRSSSFGDGLFNVVQSKNCSIDRLAEKASLDKRNIYRYMNEGIIPKKRHLVQLLVAMNLPYRISTALLYSAGYTLNSSDADVFYSLLLENPGLLTIDEANEMIFEINEKSCKTIIPEFNTH